MNNNNNNKLNDFELDKRRINTLLNINSILIQQCTTLQKSLQQQLQNQQLKESFQNYIKRIHSNLTMLATINEKYTNPISVQQKQQFPQIMTPPPQLPEVFELYQQLQNLYPEGVQFYQKKLQQLRQQQQLLSPAQVQLQQQQQQQQQQQHLSPQQVLARLNTQNNGDASNNMMHMANANNSLLW